MYDIERTIRLLGDEATKEGMKRKLLKAHAKQKAGDYALDEDERKGYAAQYRRFVNEDIENEKNIFSRLIDRLQDELKERAGQAGEFLTDYSQR